MKTSKTPWVIQKSEESKNGYSDWNTYAIRDAQNHCIAIVGAVDHATAEMNKTNALMMASAPEMFQALWQIVELFKDQGRANLPECAGIAREAINKALGNV